MLQEKELRTMKMKEYYTKANEFLLEITPDELKNSDMEKYFNIKKTFTSKQDILCGLLGALQNNQMMPNVIGFLNEDREQKFSKILFGYNSDAILENFTDASLYKLFCETFPVNNRDSKNNLWNRYSKAVISAAKFISTFRSAKDFDEFILSFSYNRYSSAALPMLLEKEVFGLGFTLACDFLKELGYSQYPKPDIHIKEIFTALDLCADTDYDAFKAVIEMAEINNDTAYNVDKIFWLIGSGNFYFHNIKIGRNKKKFIEMCHR